MTTPSILPNLRSAVSRRETVTIAGGEFVRSELQEAVRLLESSADLLEALKNMVSAYQGDLTVPERKAALSNARAAIAKATGGQS